MTRRRSETSACPAGCFDGHAGYDRRERVVSCKTCGGKGTVEIKDPEAPR